MQRQSYISINRQKVLAGGEYNVKFKGKGYLEVEELSNTLNYAANELSKVDNLRKELIANTSHDLRTPLTMIAGYGEVMRDIPGENTQNVQIIIDETNRLTALVNDMLDLSKLQSGAMHLECIPFNITQEIQRIISRYDKLLTHQEIEIIFEHNEEVEVNGDIVKLGQVIYNLINNAINYCGEDHKVIVRQLCKDQKIRLEFIDHGEGIEEEQLPYIWDRYYKVDKTHVRSKVGSGLGLSIVKAVLELHQAEYGVISKLHEGTIFWLSLPIHKN
ncbi:MAG: sensor histidine kinase [Coprobacillus cateniformis]